jgi:hypothetical protein
MARIKKTLDYLRELQNKNYSRYGDLFDLYNKWKKNLDIKVFAEFLDTIWQEKDNIKPNKYLGGAAYSNFRGIAFEEFCFDILDNTIKGSGTENAVELFWNEKILTEEFYIFENGGFKKYPKYKAVDIAIGKRENNLIHPLIIISCKTYHSTNWLDEDRAILDNVRNRYPNVFGYSLGRGLSALPVSLISSQRTGLKVFDLSKEGKLSEFISDIEEVLTEVKKECTLIK